MKSHISNYTDVNRPYNSNKSKFTPAAAFQTSSHLKSFLSKLSGLVITRLTKPVLGHKWSAGTLQVNASSPSPPLPPPSRICGTAGFPWPRAG